MQTRFRWQGSHSYDFIYIKHKSRIDKHENIIML
jgi:hypothetical protein